FTWFIAIAPATPIAVLLVNGFVFPAPALACDDRSIVESIVAPSVALTLTPAPPLTVPPSIDASACPLTLLSVTTAPKLMPVPPNRFEEDDDDASVTLLIVAVRSVAFSAVTPTAPLASIVLSVIEA